jgi:mannitol-1-phosphate 5-dehydrogenase
MADRNPDKMILFGTGKIGRSFIGQLFSRGGYEVVFIDTYRPVIEELNRRRNYNVLIKGEQTETLNISNVRGIHAEDAVHVANEIATANILAVSVGIAGLPAVIPLIAKGLLVRYQTNPELPLDIIIAENLRNASEYMRVELSRQLPSWYPLTELVGLVETSIGKMVPIMLERDIEEDILQVFAEPYNTLILDKLAFKNSIPAIQGLSPKENMKAWVDRKLFIHNLGHAATAYLGYLHNPDFVYLYEALLIPEIKKQVREAMLQAADILLSKYADEFTIEALTAHIDDLINRFQNKSLGDTIYRVGCDLMRKLGPEDRLAGAITLAIDQNLPYDKILFVLVTSFYFRATDENGKRLPGDEEFYDLSAKGTELILSDICGFDSKQHPELFQKAKILADKISHQSVR